VTIAILDMFGSSGGVGRCTKEMLREFGNEGVSTILCGQSHVVDSFNECSQTMPRLRLANLEQPRLSLRSLKIRMARKGQTNSPSLANVLIRETFKAASESNDCRQIPVLVNYPQVIPPPSNDLSYCLFLHDLNWRLYPGNFQSPALTDQNCRGWVNCAVKVITNSECTRDEVIEHYQCAPDKVVAAPLAPFDGSISSEFDKSKYLASVGLLAGRFYLFPGVWGLHKGYDTLTEALELGTATDPVVVTCGMPRDGISGNTKALSTLRGSLAARWDKLIENRKLVVVEKVSEAEMQALRTNCRAYILPSRYEGFGFPMVEAVYHGRPAIVSDIKAHQEILNRYPQYKLARLFLAGSSQALAAELKYARKELPQLPTDWQHSIKVTWSWTNTVQKILSAMTVKATYVM
jgi:glycosyltransferase involved in cell wall biosynthesis